MSLEKLRETREKIHKFVKNKLDRVKSYNISIGHSNTQLDGETLKKLMENSNTNIKSIHLMDMGCALGVHAGPGSLAVAIQPA